MAEDLIKRLKRLRNRLCDMRIIPFLGAGVSNGASHPVDSDFEPTVRYMRERLCERFDQEILNNTGKDRDRLSRLCKIINNPKGNLDRISEVCEWLWGNEKVCETIGIEKFADLQPQPAHRYLAYLAREGLITEIITTNYDCCIERAFVDTFGQSRSKEGKDAHVCITDLAEYRKHGGRRFTTSMPRRSILHIFKINGCAKQYRDYLAGQRPGLKTDESIHRRIILTERQLQSFRNEHWAKDLFRDRARSHVLVFSGFGSEEPQVRHTALNLIQEFRNIPSLPSITAEEISRLPNAPFVAAYGNLSFTQIQILDAFMTAHNPCLSGIERMKATGLNAFTGEDAEDLLAATEDHDEDHDGSSPSGLSADLFWHAVYLLGFSCLFKQFTAQGSAFLKWLELQKVPARRWQAILSESFYPEDEDEDPFDNLFGRIRHILRIEAGNPQRPLVLWQWLAIMKRPYGGVPDSDWYLPLREDPLLILVTLLFVLILTGKKYQGLKELEDCVRPIKGIGLKIKVKMPEDSRPEAGSEEAQHGSSLTVHLVGEASSGRLDLPEDHEGRRTKRLIRRIAVPSLRHLDTEKRWQAVAGHQAGVNVIRIGRVITVPARDLIRKAYLPEHLTEILPKYYGSFRPDSHPRLIPLNLSGR